MDKKYIADKRNKSKKYKNNKYSKKTEFQEKNEDTDDKHKSEHEIEDSVPSNNWSRYELVTDTQPSEGADYETLLLAPVSVDSHFKFKSEQNWDEDIKSQTQLSKYFTLNIAFLNDGISCVPFTKRHGYDDSIISAVELETIKKISETNLQNYNKIIKQKFPVKNDIIQKNSGIIKPQIQNILETNTNKDEKIVTEEMEVLKIDVAPVTICEDDVDDLLNLKYSNQITDESDIKVEDPLLEETVINKIVSPQATVDLEQWLDDILDD